MKNLVKERWPGFVLRILFVVFGFVKAVDPIGFSYKIEEYLGLYQLSELEGTFRIFFYTALCSGNDSWVAVAPPLVAESYRSGGDTFYTWIYHPDLLDLYRSARQY